MKTLEEYLNYKLQNNNSNVNDYNNINIEDAINHDAEEMYNILLEQKQKDPEKNFQNQESQNGDGNNTFEDNHDIWNEQKNYKENKQLISLRDWLLPMLMNGQATVED